MNRSSRISVLMLLLVCSFTLSARETVYGEPMPAGEAVAIGEALSAPLSYEGRSTKFFGRITEVCQKKGCWAILTDPSQTQTVRVKFKNHDDGLPFDASGPAVVYGELKQVEVGKRLAEHFAEDAGKDPDTAVATVERQITATSVTLIEQ